VTWKERCTISLRRAYFGGITYYIAVDCVQGRGSSLSSKRVTRNLSAANDNKASEKTLFERYVGTPPERKNYLIYDDLTIFKLLTKRCFDQFPPTPKSIGLSSTRHNHRY